MNMTGSWYSPAYSSEGLDVFEHADGRIVAHFFSYLEREQMWLVCTGKRILSPSRLECWTTSGGHIGNIADLADVEETPWGHITLTDVAGGLNVKFEPTGKPSWAYTMQPIFDPVPVAPPVVVPPVIEPPPVVEPATSITIDKWFHGRWLDITPGKLPLMSSAPVAKSRIVTGGLKWLECRITATKGTLTITKAAVSGPNNPKMTGIKKGDVIQEGESIEFDLYIGPLTSTATSGWDQSNYGISTAELGEIFRVSAQVLYAS